MSKHLTSQSSALLFDIFHSIKAGTADAIASLSKSRILPDRFLKTLDV